MTVTILDQFLTYEMPKSKFVHPAVHLIYMPFNGQPAKSSATGSILRDWPVAHRQSHPLHTSSDGTKTSCMWMIFGNCTHYQRESHFLSSLAVPSCLCVFAWLDKGYFHRFFQFPFSVAPSRCIKCNLGPVPGSLFKTQKVQYFLCAASRSSLG